MITYPVSLYLSNKLAIYEYTEHKNTKQNTSHCPTLSGMKRGGGCLAGKVAVLRGGKCGDPIAPGGTAATTGAEVGGGPAAARMEGGISSTGSTSGSAPFWK